jgi:NAD(P)-dependent dehydrogenase (short-subunit alcohol dehydrogenase family)
MASMEGQVALVTGGARGIGLAISTRLVARGVKVALGYSRGAEQAKGFAAAHEGASIHQGNIGVAADCQRVISEVLEQHGQLDVLVNNAGITIDRTVRKMSVEDWDRVIHVNLSGAFYLSRAVLQSMLDRGYGRIINISSVIGEKGNIGQANYAAAKSGLFGLTNSLALETARKGITVNSMAPGWDGRGHPRGGPAAGDRQIPVGAGASRTRWPGWWSSWPTRSRATSPGRSMGSTAASAVPGRSKRSDDLPVVMT